MDALCFFYAVSLVDANGKSQILELGSRVRRNHGRLRPNVRALPDAQGAPRQRSLRSENAHPVKHCYQINGVDANKFSAHDFGDVGVPAPASIGEIRRSWVLQGEIPGACLWTSPCLCPPPELRHGLFKIIGLAQSTRVGFGLLTSISRRDIQGKALV